MPERLHRSGSGSTKVPSGVQFVGRLKQIQAQKGSGSNWPNEYFKHDFKSRPKMYKISSRSSNPPTGKKIYDRLEKAVLEGGTISFKYGKVYGKSNGNVVLTTDKGKYLIVGARPLWDIFKYPDR